MRLKQYLKRFLKPSCAVVLMYHRVADPEADPWQLAVSPANFEAQLRWLKSKYTLVTPQDLAVQIGRGKVAANQVCLTFDDGYRDNYTTALPLLQKHGCPATFFISTYFLQTGRLYWWDLLQEIVFNSPELPSPFSFNVGGETVTCALENEGRLTPELQALQNNWVWSAAPPTQRCRLYFSLWEKMRPLPQREIERLLTQLQEKTDVAALKKGAGEPMTLSNLREMSRHPLVHIGLHTHTHPVLSLHGMNVQQNELAENKKMLEEVCGYPMTVLSYPHGKYNDYTVSIVKKMALTAAFTTNSEAISPKSLPQCLGRIQVTDGGIEAFAAVLEKAFAY